MQLQFLENRLNKDQDLRDKYTNTNKEHLDKAYTVTVLDNHSKERCSNRERFLSHHAVINPNRSGRVITVLIGAAKFHGASLNITLLNDPDLLENFVHLNNTHMRSWHIYWEWF